MRNPHVAQFTEGDKKVFFMLLQPETLYELLSPCIWITSLVKYLIEADLLLVQV